MPVVVQTKAELHDDKDEDDDAQDLVVGIEVPGLEGRTVRLHRP